MRMSSLSNAQPATNGGLWQQRRRVRAGAANARSSAAAPFVGAHSPARPCLGLGSRAAPLLPSRGKTRTQQLARIATTADPGEFGKAPGSGLPDESWVCVHVACAAAADPLTHSKPSPLLKRSCDRSGRAGPCTPRTNQLVQAVVSSLALWRRMHTSPRPHAIKPPLPRSPHPHPKGTPSRSSRTSTPRAPRP
jgi:hypothetical protein